VAEAVNMCQLIDRRECDREVELSKYEFEPLREDGALILYRARSREEQVEILVLSLLGERPLPESVKRLENEYSLREELDPAWATQPFCLTAHGDRTALLLHDPGGLPLDHLLRKQSSPSLDSLVLAAKKGHLRNRWTSSWHCVSRFVFRPQLAPCTGEASFTRTSNRPMFWYVP
jgi:hypothetical protein